MKTCRRFETLREDYERDIAILRTHSERHAGKASAKTSATHALSAKTRMARALSGHVRRCPECG
ncbi:hypothetical protein RKD23_001046 [Streptomyces sp. SAI-170]|uniref:hypothetical protein n=1 Tax=Streptomyces sp. enrichment culture TaxID=1795815 RepID=UPI003CB3C521